MKLVMICLAMCISSAASAGVWDCKVSSLAPNGQPVGVAWSIMTRGQWVAFPPNDPTCIYACGEDQGIPNPTGLPMTIVPLDGCSVAGPSGSTYIEHDQWKPVSCIVPEMAYFMAMCKN